MNTISNIEKEYVINTYNCISHHFSSTRYSHWKSVKEFIEESCKTNLCEKKNFLDYGCGNGKYLSLLEKFNTSEYDKFNITGFDNCDEFLQIVKKNYPKTNIYKGDICEFKSELYSSFDIIICIAVIHHLSTENRRIDAIKNIISYLKPNGKALISVWSNSIDKSKFTKLNSSNDYLIGWNNKFQRYYHLFEENELMELIKMSDVNKEIDIITTSYECDNWFIEIKKRIVKI